jgi:8-oxo-dGTP pyrophosphatase MutT (NUDIX family)
MHRTISSRLNRFFAAFRPPRRKQVAALCWRNGRKGIEVLFVTTRRTGRWTPPKGHLMEGKTPAEAAAIEAWEEAGVTGTISAIPVGEYEYMKFRNDGLWERLAVDIYPLKVEAEANIYPEKAERMRRWFPLEKAPAMVNEATLRKVITTFSPER